MNITEKANPKKLLPCVDIYIYSGLHVGLSFVSELSFKS